MPQAVKSTDNVSDYGDAYAASVFREGVWVGRREAITVLLDIGAGGRWKINLDLLNEFSRRLTTLPEPPFRH